MTKESNQFYTELNSTVAKFYTEKHLYIYLYISISISRSLSQYLQYLHFKFKEDLKQ